MQGKTDDKRKRILTAEVMSQENLSEGIFSLWLSAGEIAACAEPGQFVNLYCRDRARLLPRPISICEIDRDREWIRLVYRVTGRNTGTEEFSERKAGDRIQVLGPLGRGFPTEEIRDRRVLLIGGGIGIPPLLQTGRELSARPTFVLGYRSKPFLKNEFAEAGDLFMASEDGCAGTRGTVLDAVRENGLRADAVFACGPLAMLRAVASWADAQGIPCWISLEERMACGVGACLGCMCRTVREDEHFHTAAARVCTDGPVFRSTEVVW